MMKIVQDKSKQFVFIEKTHPYSPTVSEGLAASSFKDDILKRKVIPIEGHISLALLQVIAHL